MSFLLFRYPDKPFEVTPDYLEDLDDSWIGQLKLDGWRCVLMTDSQGQIRAFTRQNMRLAKALHRDDDFEPALLEVVRTLPLPPLSAVDGEFIGRRNKDVVEHEMYAAFDLMYLGGQWLGELPFKVRWQALYDLCRLQAPTPHQKRFVLVPMIVGNLREFFDNSWKNPLCEGVVCKKLDSKLIGSPNHSEQNPDWIKCKRSK